MVRIVAALVAVTVLSACSGADFASRNAPFEILPSDGTAASPPAVAVAVPAEPQTAVPPEQPLPTQARSPYTISGYSVSVPEKLKVSEANLYYPVTDIVWRGDPYGNRKRQIIEIFQESISRATPGIDGPRPVTLAIELKRFHSITEKTRYTIGGMHSISFYVTVTDAETGEVLIDRRKVKADLEAFGGQRALAADRQGLGMKERIQRHLARVLAVELSHPGGWAAAGALRKSGIDQI
ncbi:hypothetical protein KUH32_14140 [Thalassococcus sp. CAU 1522]|uniref:Lipoprotein n=1 Tax=Thalassococcus arenae TaxID=2851652 RepID=A0ABS6NA76_9RHOB|nr:DUF6778 family protein [Thalassococcus arenae]MBV2360904.1 hypothetical protein [Thalassococcus arenae]